MNVFILFALYLFLIVIANNYKNGVLYIHGPRSNRCGGSGMLPLQIQPSQLMPSIPSVSLPPCASARSPALRGEVLSAVDSHGVRAGLSTQEASNQPALFQYSSAIRVLKRIPKASRHLAATKLALILNDVVTQNTDDAWSQLFNFPPNFWFSLEEVARGVVLQLQ